MLRKTGMIKTGLFPVFRYRNPIQGTIRLPLASISEHFKGGFIPNSGNLTAILTYSRNHVPELTTFCNLPHSGSAIFRGSTGGAPTEDTSQGIIDDMRRPSCIRLRGSLIISSGNDPQKPPFPKSEGPSKPRDPELPGKTGVFLCPRTTCNPENDRLLERT